jgi:hypothetical protein
MTAAVPVSDLARCVADMRRWVRAARRARKARRRVAAAHLTQKLGAYDVQITDLSFALDYEFSKPRSTPRLPKRSGRDALRGWAKRAV